MSPWAFCRISLSQTSNFARAHCLVVGGIELARSLLSRLRGSDLGQLRQRRFLHQPRRETRCQTEEPLALGDVPRRRRRHLHRDLAMITGVCQRATDLVVVFIPVQNLYVCMYVYLR